MPLRDFTVTGQTGAWDYQEVATYLTGHGYQIGPGGIGTALDPHDPTTVLVRVDLDPHIPDATVRTDLAAFAPSHPPEATAQVEMRKAVALLAAAAAGTATPDVATELAIHRRAILAYAATVGIVVVPATVPITTPAPTTTPPPKTTPAPTPTTVTTPALVQASGTHGG